MGRPSSGLTGPFTIRFNSLDARDQAVREYLLRFDSDRSRELKRLAYIGMQYECGLLERKELIDELESRVAQLLDAKLGTTADNHENTQSACHEPAPPPAGVVQQTVESDSKEDLDDFFADHPKQPRVMPSPPRPKAIRSSQTDYTRPAT